MSIQETKRYSVFEYPPKVLILGASGYLGQFLTVGQGASCRLILKSSKDVDFAKGSEGEFEEKLRDDRDMDVVINLAAISSPAECAKDPAKAEKVNIPIGLFQFLNTLSHKPLLIHLSTDQVFEGTEPFSTESSDASRAVNEYGRTKWLAEQAIRKLYPTNHVILRSSIILGPNPPLAELKNRISFLMFIYNQLSKNQATSFFHDEFRSFISVFDIIDVIRRCISNRLVFENGGETFNMGSPDRLSRADMAYVVCDICKFDKQLVQAVSASTVNRGVKTPADISMNSSKIEAFMGRKMTDVRVCVRQSLVRPPSL